MTPLRRAAASTALIAALCLVAGCGDDGGSGESDSGVETFEVEEAGISFEVPADWEGFDKDKMVDAVSDTHVLDDMSDRLGLDPEQFKAMMSSNVSLMVTAPHAEGGFLDNINVQVIDASLPSSGSAELQYRSIGATDIESSDIETAVGDGYSVDYHLEINDREIEGNALALLVNGKTVVITISTDDRGATDELSGTVEDSLAETD